MARVLVICDEHQDYLADYLYDGFCSLFDPAYVVDWPPKASLHDGDRLRFDCDLNWPSAGYTESRVLMGLRDRGFDLIVVPTLRGRVPALLQEWQVFLEKMADRVVAVDGEDHCLNTRPLFEQALGFPPAVYAKRELPCGETWAIPLPFGYPERRLVRPSRARMHRAFYAVQVWPWARGGLRERLGQRLQEVGRHVVRMTYDGAERISPRRYHEMAACSSIGIAPAGQGYFTNRLFELVAAGCALVAEQPSMTFPDAFVSPIECTYFRDEFEAELLLETYMGDRRLTQRTAEAGQAALVDRHLTRHRALTLMRSVHGTAAC